MTHDLVDPLSEQTSQPFALERIGDACIDRIDVERELPFAPQVVVDVLVRGKDVAGVEAEARRDATQETCGRGLVGAAWLVLVSDQRAIAPEGFAVLAPEEIQGPAWQRLAGVPLPLPEVHEAVRRVLVAEPMKQLHGERLLLLAERSGVPLYAVEVLRGDEGGFAAHRQADVTGAKLRIDLHDTDQRRFAVAGGGSAKRYLNPWLSFDTQLPGGARLELQRAEQCDYTHQSFGRRQVFTWAYAFEDSVTLHGASTPAAPVLPERFTLRALEAKDGRVTLKVSSALRWDTGHQEGALDAADLVLQWLALLGSRPLRPQPLEPVTAHCWACLLYTSRCV